MMKFHSLKSNMDRFIVPKANETEKYNKGLKSNMDRFIGKILLSKINSSVCLKSNMDRFIVFSFAHSIRKRNMFKIQYG